MLIDNYKGDFVEKILSYAELFFNVNPESYKFLARVLSANNFLPQAEVFFECASIKLYNDPELHFLIANVRSAQGDIKSALKELDECLNILPEYFPALKLKSQLNNSHV